LEFTLGERNVRDAVGLVDFNPNEVLCLGGVLDVMSCVVGEIGSISSAEVDSTCRSTSNEYSGATSTAVEIQPFSSLLNQSTVFDVLSGNYLHWDASEAHEDHLVQG
jgi:hypothetical protein